ncbi:phage portal protein [Herbaspirillum rubrisubalbicans]|uniref:Phage portal protein n=2 Tax=Herbaspirillum rubrisubalbicans TaxID=80842 RepID=A0AAD0XIF1_9BURK|nr:phage portal protein [Herbaspirillum rubrisubalbicans]AYR25774.1 phage portal protein [Herbaspirillum rubrisubalbicans]
MSARGKLDLAPNVIDKVVSYFDPVAGTRRMQARAHMAIAGSYVGADRSRRSFRNWFTSGKSADEDLLPDLATLRENSRDLIRNAPLAGGAINTVVTNVVGTGLAMRPAIDGEALGMSEEQVQAWQRSVTREYLLWAENPLECDSTATQNFYDLQDLAFRSALINGDAFGVLPSNQVAHCLYATKVQVIEGDRVMTPPDLVTKGNVFGGIELDDFGAMTAVHVCDQHPGSVRIGKKPTFTRIAARGSQTGRRNVVHLFKRLRPDQHRGEPYLAAVIEPLKQLDRYTEAEIMAAVISGMFTVFIEHEADQDQPAPIYDDNKEKAAPELALSSGAIIDLAKGEKVNTANPGRPNAQFDPFVMAILRQIGVNLELPFEVLIKHYTASYSAARAAMLDAWKFFRVRRAWLASNFCQPIYETWLAEAVAIGRLSAPGFFADAGLRRAWCQAVWLGDGPSSLDPLKEASAIEKRVDIGVTTLEEEVAAYDGGDWETKHKQRVKEQRMRREGGLLDAAPSTPPPDLPPDPD